MASKRQKMGNDSDEEDEKSDEEQSHRKTRMRKAYDGDADLAVFGKELRQVEMEHITVDPERLKLDC